MIRVSLFRFLLVLIICTVGIAELSAAPVKQTTLELTEVEKNYNAWFQVFLSDYRDLVKRSEKPEPISPKEVDEIFKHSIAPSSKMTKFLLFLYKKQGLKRQHRGIYPLGSIFLLLLKESAPMSDGGSHAGLSLSRVAYLKLSKAEGGNPYAGNKAPAAGTFMRERLPFLVFQKTEAGKLVLYSISKELYNVMRAIRTRQML